MVAITASGADPAASCANPAICDVPAYRNADAPRAAGPVSPSSDAVTPTTTPNGTIPMSNVSPSVVACLIGRVAQRHRGSSAQSAAGSPGEALCGGAEGGAVDVMSAPSRVEVVTKPCPDADLLPSVATTQPIAGTYLTDHRRCMRPGQPG